MKGMQDTFDSERKCYEKEIQNLKKDHDGALKKAAKMCEEVCNSYYTRCLFCLR